MQTSEWSSRYQKYQQSPKGKAKAYVHNRRPDVVAKARAAVRSPRGRYGQQKHAAQRRGVEFLLTFDEWWSIWEPYWPQRGKRSAQLCMARHNDEGPYAVGNVSIVTNAENTVVRNRRQANLSPIN